MEELPWTLWRLFDAKTHLSALVDRVSQGQEITITKHGVPVAVLVPPANRRRKDPAQVAERVRALRRGARLEGVTIRQLIEEGRRYRAVSSLTPL